MIPHNKLVLHPEDHEVVARVMASGHIGQGPEVEAFEHELAARFRPDGAAVCVSSGTAALYLALNALGLDRITLPTFACSSLWYASERAGCRAELVDLEPDRPHSTATIGVHTFGLIDPRRVPIEDFTHAPVGPAGTFGTLAVASFGPTKPLAAGAGGVVLGDRNEIECIRDWRDYDGKGAARSGRFNFQMSDLHAAIGRRKLARLDQDLEWRRATAARYSAALKLNPPGAMTSWYRYVVRLEGDPARPIVAQSFLRGWGVETIYPIRPDELIHRITWKDRAAFPVAEHVAATTLSIPIWPGMTDDQVDTVCRALEGVC